MATHAHGTRLTAKEWDAVRTACGFALAGEVAEAVGEDLVDALYSAHEKLQRKGQRR